MKVRAKTKGHSFLWFSYLCPDPFQDENVSMILQGFLSDHDMFSEDYPSICAVNEDLEASMKREMDSRHLPAPEMNKTLPASLVEVRSSSKISDSKCLESFLNLPTQVSSINLRYLIYIDDTSPDDTTDYVAFEERFLRTMPQLNPFASVLWAMFDFYPVPFANSLINGTFEYISGTCIEPAVKTLQLTGASFRFPWFLRARTGLGVGFALSLFPKSRQVDYVSCFQAMPDMEFWICASDDLLSYHKERLAGETANYISNRATVEARSALLITSDIRREL
ncbi:hypothetical protein H0H93_004980 [Arthromyces matolae]|nr:hypothetical protein H0H93_004980 [Arthromyces matolae]